uniref:(California timema) hypothetical protein n=1 Tax=Timema californicum TaxID=61474 RepID=A0A7R9P7C9_TIMCA|nr:unnamed protein product [Timema californicum]
MGYKAQGAPPRPEGHYNNNIRRLLILRSSQNSVNREWHKDQTNWSPVTQ